MFFYSHTFVFVFSVLFACYCPLHLYDTVLSILAGILRLGQGDNPENTKKNYHTFFGLNLLVRLIYSLHLKEDKKKGVPIIKIAHFPINRIYLWENKRFFSGTPGNKKSLKCYG